jgi:hypothetical protein
MQTAPVTEKAIVARINRNRKPDLEMLRKSRGRMMESNFGEFYVIDLRRNCILDTHVDPETYARELGVMRGYEFIEDEHAQSVAT